MAVRNQTSGNTSGRVDNLRRPSGRVPQQSVMRSNQPTDVTEQPPYDAGSFENEGNDTSASSPMGATRNQPKPAGTRPMNVTATVKPPKAPGLVSSQGRVANARPASPGLNQKLSADVRRPKAPGLNQAVNAVRKTQKLSPVPAQRNRNVRPGSANPAFYHDFT